MWSHLAGGGGGGCLRRGGGVGGSSLARRPGAHPTCAARRARRCATTRRMVVRGGGCRRPPGGTRPWLGEEVGGGRGRESVPARPPHPSPQPLLLAVGGPPFRAVDSTFFFFFFPTAPAPSPLATVRAPVGRAPSSWSRGWWWVGWEEHRAAVKQPQPVLLPLSPPPAGAPAHAPCRTMVVVGERVGGWRGTGHCVGAVLCPAPPPPPPSPLPLQAVVGRPRAASAGRSAALAGTPSRFVWLAV